MRRISLSVVLVLALSLMLAACGSKSKNSSSTANGSTNSAATSSITGADVVPASATAFVSVATDSTNGHFQQAMKLLDKVPSLQKSMTKSLTKDKITLAQIEGAAGPATDVVILGSAAAKNPTTILLSNPSDPSKLKALLNKGTGAKPVTTTIGAWLVAADSQKILSQFQTAAAAGKLADSADYKAAEATIPADALVKVYAPGAAITKALMSGVSSALKSSSSSSSGLSLGSVTKALGKTKIAWIAASADAVPQGLLLDAVVKGNQPVTNSSSTLLGVLPSGTSFAVDLNGKSLGLDKAVMGLRNNKKYASQIPQIEAAMGIKLQDLANLVGSEMTVYGTQSGIGILIKAPDPAKSKAMLDRVVKLLGTQLGGGAKSVTIGGVSATELTISKTTIYFGVKDGDLFFATDASALPGSAKLTSDPTYSTATAALSVPSANLGVAYLDFAGIAKLGKSPIVKSLSSSLSSLGSSSSSTVNAKQLSALSALLGYAVGNGTQVELKAILTLK